MEIWNKLEETFHTLKRTTTRVQVRDWISFIGWMQSVVDSTCILTTTKPFQPNPQTLEQNTPLANSHHCWNTNDWWVLRDSRQSTSLHREATPTSGTSMESCVSLQPSRGLHHKAWESLLFKAILRGNVWEYCICKNQFTLSYPRLSFLCRGLVLVDLCRVFAID